VSNDIMTEVDIPQGLEILQSCSHSERKRVHTTTIYSTALDDRLGFRLGGAEGLSPPEHSGTFVGLGFWPPLHQSRCRCNAHVLYEVVCPSTLSFRDSVITEHLDEWCAGYSLFSVQDFLTSLSHMAESQTDTKVPIDCAKNLSSTTCTVRMYNASGCLRFSDLYQYGNSHRTSPLKLFDASTNRSLDPHHCCHPAFLVCRSDHWG
jgi:hypothetical protein